MDKTIVAGTNNVVLAKVEFDPQDGDVKLEDIYFESSVDLNDAYKNISLVTDAGTVVGQAELTGNFLEFENMSTLITEETFLYITADVKTTVEYNGTL
jgi:hypothetical protein